MDSVVTALTPDHLKLLLCLILAALSIIKLGEIQDKNTQIRRDHQLQLIHSSNQQQSPHWQDNPHKDRQAKQHHGTHQRSSSSIPPRHANPSTNQEAVHKKVGESQWAGTSPQHQSPTLGSYVFSKYCRKLEETNRNPLFTHSPTLLQRQYQMEEEIRHQKTEEAYRSNTEAGSKKEHETPKVSRQLDIREMGTGRTEASSTWDKIGLSKQESKRWPSLQLSQDAVKKEKHRGIKKIHRHAMEELKMKKPSQQQQWLMKHGIKAGKTGISRVGRPKK